MRTVFDFSQSEALVAAMLRVLVLALCAAAVSALQVYGAEPGAFDSVVDTFECDGGRSLPVARINDDYCDCSDGSDEPGAR